MSKEIIEELTRSFPEIEFQGSFLDDEETDRARAGGVVNHAIDLKKACDLYFSETLDGLRPRIKAAIDMQNRS